MIDKRKNSRVPFQVSIDLKFPDQSHTGCETVDLSSKGVFVLGVTGHKTGENCLISLQLAGSTSNLVLTMKGTVARVTETGLALHFYEIDMDSFFHLQNILHYNSTASDPLSDDL